MNKDPLFFNKLAGAFLTALLIALFSGFLANLFFGAGHETGEEAKKAYTELLPEGTADLASAGGGDAEQLVPIDERLATASLEAGGKVARKCKACHVFEKGGVNRIGPHMWGLIGRKKGGIEGFVYSQALLEKGGQWDVVSLDEFLANPKGWLPGTKMNFAGVKKPSQRADLILWLNQQSDNPLQLP